MFDQILFGLTSAASLVAALIIVAKMTRSGGLHRALWTVSFALLAVLTAEVALYGLGVLSQPFVNPVSSLIPGLLAAGLLLAWKERVGYYYLGYVIAAFVVLLATTILFSVPPVAFAVFVHIPSGLVIFLLPFYTALKRQTKWSSILVGFGGLLIGVGGLALATLTAGVPILPSDVVFELLAPIFFAMALLFALGLLVTPGWGRGPKAEAKHT